MVETHLLLVCHHGPSHYICMSRSCFTQSYYALILNRRHSAYHLAGSAVRLAVIMGLHLPAPPSVIRDARLREHRNRIWWTAYTFDRMWAAKLGYPNSISDCEINVALPTHSATAGYGEEGPESAYLEARIGLARLCGDLVGLIYGESPQQKTSLYRRVQRAFNQLQSWKKDLPDSLKVNGRPLDPRAVSLHLLWNHVGFLQHFAFDQLRY